MPPSQAHPELQALRLSAEQEVTSHGYLRDHYLGWGQRLNVYVLSASAVILFFTLASEEFMHETLNLPADAYRSVEGVAVFLTFCLSLVDLAWNPASKAKAHDQAVNHFTRMGVELSNALAPGANLSAEKVRWIQDEFMDTADMPSIPEAQALRFRQMHMVKQAMLRLLEKNPHQPLWWLRVRLWWNPAIDTDKP